MYKYAYADLSNPGVDLGFIRLSGPGLANCLFLASRAKIFALKNNLQLIDPTWRKFSIGPYLRKERDKRSYTDLFLHNGIYGLKKLILLIKNRKDTCVFSKIDGYFEPLYDQNPTVVDYLNTIINPAAIKSLEGIDLSDHVAVHVRLGDYPESWRIPIDWYDNIITQILSINPNLKIALFSDGKDEELSQLLERPEVYRHFYGNAISDILAISKCRLLIASDSTFSGWGAYIGQVPVIFYRRHFPPVHSPSSNIPEIVMSTHSALPKEIVFYLS